jgi:hypothetical protein
MLGVPGQRPRRLLRKGGSGYWTRRRSYWDRHLERHAPVGTGPRPTSRLFIADLEHEGGPALQKCDASDMPDLGVHDGIGSPSG